MARGPDKKKHRSAGQSLPPEPVPSAVEGPPAAPRDEDSLAGSEGDDLETLDLDEDALVTEAASTDELNSVERETDRVPSAEHAARGGNRNAASSGLANQIVLPSGSAAEPLKLTVESRAHGWRIDHYLSRLFPNYSRALFQRAIEQQGVLINGLPVKMSRRLRVNDLISVRLPEAPDEALPAEDLPLSVLFEDEYLIVLDKAAGMITHPGKAHYRGTLAGALQFHFDQLSTVAGRFRPGIVHRLDRDTSGVIIVAKNNQVHHKLSAQFEHRQVKKEYRAIVWGVIAEDSGYIETYLRVNPKHREKMMVCEPEGNARHALTYYEVLERFYDFTWVRLLPQTGRTHQLRVHLRHLGHPIIADDLYGGRESLTRSYLLGQTLRDRPVKRGRNKGPADEASEDVLIQRQALHAFRLAFRHPADNREMQIEAPLPTDMQRVLDTLHSLKSPPG